MLRKKSFGVLIIISIVLLLNSGCNLLISMIERNTPPDAISGNDFVLYINETALLDGSESYDPDGDELSFDWSIQTKPGDSQLENSDITNRFTQVASVILNIEGEFTFKLTVSDTLAESTDFLTITVVSLPIITPTPNQGQPTPTPNQNQPTPTPAPTPPFDLAAEYLFNGNVYDSSGYENHGTVSGVTLTTDRQSSSNNASYFGGDGDYINCGNGASLNFDSGITIALWVRPEDFYANVILSKMESPERGYELGIYVDTIIFFSGETSIVTAPIDAGRLNTWFHIAITFASFSIDDPPRIYIDGSLLGNSTMVTSIQLSDGDLYLGISEFTEYDYQGAIDDLRIYDHVLSQEDIIDVMNIITS